jgi:hypothetical protein
VSARPFDANSSRRLSAKTQGQVAHGALGAEVEPAVRRHVQVPLKPSLLSSGRARIHYPSADRCRRQMSVSPRRSLPAAMGVSRQCADSPSGADRSPSSQRPRTARHRLAQALARPLTTAIVNAGSRCLSGSRRAGHQAQATCASSFQSDHPGANRRTRRRALSLPGSWAPVPEASSRGSPRRPRPIRRVDAAEPPAHASAAELRKPESRTTPRP